MATLTCNFPTVDYASPALPSSYNSVHLIPFPACSIFLHDGEECFDIQRLFDEPAGHGSADASAERLDKARRACWAECSVGICRAQYIEAHPDVAETLPICWYCRNDQACPSVVCTRCANRVIIPSPYREALDLPSYLCVECIEVFTKDDARLLDTITKAIAELDSCAICCTTTSLSNLLSACDQPGCRPKVDDACLRTWYGANQLGCVPLNIGQLLCPFCRRAPTAPTIIKYNPPASVLVGLQEAIDDKEFHYGWCEDCACAKRAMARTCGADADDAGTDPPDSRNFVCEECLEVRRRESDAAMRFTPCPKCSVYVEKTAGCNHITCVCGAHFCHVCGIEATLETIMEHLKSVHGGIYDAHQDESENEGFGLFD